MITATNLPNSFNFSAVISIRAGRIDYNWETAKPDFSAVVRHFKAVNPPTTVTRVKNELEDLLSLDLEEEKLTDVLAELGSNFHAPAENLTNRQWLENILNILRESPTTARVLRELK